MDILWTMRKPANINNNLSWDRLIDKIVDKGNKTLRFICRNLKDCTKLVKSAAYTAMVRSTVEYQTKKRSNP